MYTDVRRQKAGSTTPVKLCKQMYCFQSSMPSGPFKYIKGRNMLRHLHAFNQNEHCYVNIAPSKGIACSTDTKWAVKSLIILMRMQKIMGQTSQLGAKS